MTPLSVLDLSFVSADSTPARALHDTLALARHVDNLGYRRYWLATLGSAWCSASQ